MNRLQEQYVFNAFKRLYSEFPVGQYYQTEQPDFIINSYNKIIGVEITQIFIDNYLDQNLNEKQKEGLQGLLGNNLCEKLDALLPFKFVLAIDFSKKSFSKHEISSIVLQCESYFKKIQLPEKFISINFENLGQFPDEIDNINLFMYPTIKKSFFSQSAPGVLPDMTLQHLQVILNKKEQSLKKYKHCDKYWLLIEEGTFFADSFGDISVVNFNTVFDKIFLYRHAKGELIQMK